MKKTFYPFLIAFSLFSYCPLVNAECGWVLWLQRDVFYFSEVKEHVSWDIVSAYPKFNLCVEGKRVMWHQIKRNYKERKKESQFMELDIDDKKEFLHVTYKGKDDSLQMSEILGYKCLPDTLDPRTPKK